MNPIGTKRRSILMEDNVTSDAVKDHPAGTGRNGKRVIVGVAAAVAVVLAVGGVCGYRAWEDHRVSVARGACGSAVAAQKKAVDSYRTLLDADATTAALKTDVKAVKDAKTLDALKRAVGAETPAMVKCDASGKAGLDAAAAKADKTAKGVKADAKTLQAAVRAVESSKLDKTVDDADGLYRATEGKVQDDKTRDALKQAIAKRDADAIAKTVKAVNDSKTAKDKADAEAREKAEREAQAVAAAAAQAQAVPRQPYSGHSGGQSSSQSYSGGSQGQGGGSPSGNSPAPSIHYDWEDNTGDQYNCQPDKFCPLG